MAQPKNILIFSGPNGAGKTTFATEYLPNEAQIPIFANADLIAAGLSPFSPDSAIVQAGRLMVDLIRRYVARSESFGLETTLSGLVYARSIPQWQRQGYRIKLFFLRLPSPDMAVARVAQRVLEGGHDESEELIRRRFRTGLANFENIYRDLVDEYEIHDNSGGFPVLLRKGRKK